MRKAPVLVAGGLAAAYFLAPDGVKDSAYKFLRSPSAYFSPAPDQNRERLRKESSEFDIVHTKPYMKIRLADLEAVFDLDMDKKPSEVDISNFNESDSLPLIYNSNRKENVIVGELLGLRKRKITAGQLKSIYNTNKTKIITTTINGLEVYECTSVVEGYESDELIIDRTRIPRGYRKIEITSVVALPSNWKPGDDRVSSAPISNLIYDIDRWEVYNGESGDFINQVATILASGIDIGDMDMRMNKKQLLDEFKKVSDNFNRGKIDKFVEGVIASTSR